MKSDSTTPVLKIEKAKAQRLQAGFIPNPKLKLLEQVSEVMRFKHYSIRTETTYREWIKRFIFFRGKRHPREMGALEVEGFQERVWKMILIVGADVRIPHVGSYEEWIS